MSKETFVNALAVTGKRFIKIAMPADDAMKVMELSNIALQRGIKTQEKLELETDNRVIECDDLWFEVDHEIIYQNGIRDN